MALFPPRQAPDAAGGGRPTSAEPTVWSVSGLQRMLRMELERNHGAIAVTGEVSGLKIHAGSGHAYFTLKDDQAQLACVMWRAELQRLRFRLDEGQEVILRGRLTVYEKGGRLQLTVQTIEPKGRGAQEEAFRKLAEKLRQEGLTAPERKRRLPFFPKVIGVVTSKSGAALRDILRTAQRRDPFAAILVSPAAVQGEGAAEEIAQAIERLGRWPEVEVIIVARGGGSREDLSCFNAEVVARAIVAAPVPVVTGIGHEIDTSIADMVADLACSTPTASAEAVIPVRSEVAARFFALEQRMARATRRHEERGGRALSALEARLNAQAPTAQLHRRAQELDELLTRAERHIRAVLARSIGRTRQLESRLERFLPRARTQAFAGQIDRLLQSARSQTERILERDRQRLALGAARLEALSPVAVLGRGYALVRGPGGALVRDVAQLRPHDSLQIRLARGEITARVESTRRLEEEQP